MTRPNVWTQSTVNGDEVTLTVNGQVVLLHTGAPNVAVDDLYFGRHTPGHPVEMSRTQLQGLRAMIDEALEVVLDEHDTSWLAGGTDAPQG